MLSIRVPATTANLGPGFDCLGLALNLYNEFAIQFDAKKTEITIEGDGAASLPRDENNLLLTTIRQVLEKYDLRTPACKAHMTLRVPLCRGLGSSATAIVAGVLSAFAYAQGKIPERKLLTLATAIEGHPDNVAPALYGGLTVCLPRPSGDVWYRRIPVPLELRVVAAVPDFQLETQTARAVLPDQVTLGAAVKNLQNVAYLVAAFLQSDLGGLEAANEDRFHEPYRAKLVPGFAAIRQLALGAGAKACVLSGAGPTVVALAAADSNLSAIGEAMCHGFAQEGIKATFQVLEPDLNGATLTMCES